MMIPVPGIKRENKLQILVQKSDDVLLALWDVCTIKTVG